MTSAIDTQKQMMMMGFPFSDLHPKGDKSFALRRECHFRPCSRTNLNLNDIVFSISIFCPPRLEVRVRGTSYSSFAHSLTAVLGLLLKFMSKALEMKLKR